MQDVLVAQVLQYGTEPDPAKRLRQEWGRSLEEHLDLAGLNRKELLVRLAEHGCSVSHQALSQWIKGDTSPRPHHQAAIAAVLRVPVRSLFPIEAVA